ncbi:acyl-CoA dehydratase activase [Pseudodesulfovibrio piezophilus]|uniref:CoA-substrate-specific enzyme activase n=1 Tax=Pseudodesulfovibrio piezophilus (strain DSM 21447 / JCM 15486 / C1TLV30) TaxID=1322246 RepID=M1WP04_PSEP2|nr:acyl-CoA dehydratase activase [Pseudodesulfovibrio piezophilus]CCH47919.1 CoA-substrate-specific enzyme activase [Pseudodesulfovibrio piezophilus C1TLV30]
MKIGIDIGSRSIELVALRDGKLCHSARVPTTFDPISQCSKLLDGLRPASLVGTGYGRNLIQRLGLECPCDTITEIKAHAIGAFSLFPQVRTVLDIGGQDTKAVSISAGRVLKFEMNDRCAAGTGKFLEYTAGVFQIPVEDFGSYAMKGHNPPEISSICTVFAETEATSLMARGESPESIALGLHKAIVKRTITMMRRVGLKTPIVFSGGVANNLCVLSLLAHETGAALGEELLVPDEPDMIGALGAALHCETLTRSNSPSANKIF